MPMTLAQMQALFNDNTAGDISAADGRDVIEGLYEQDQGAPPVDGDFSWVNQNSAVLNVNTRGHISIIAPHNASGSLSCRVKSAPATPYTITARCGFSSVSKDFHAAGLLFREAGTGEITTFGPAFNVSQKTSVFLWASATSFGSSYASVPAEVPQWLRIADNGTNRIYSTSADGENWVDYFSHGRTSDMTPDQVGFFVNAQNGAVPNLSMQIVVKSWDQA